MKDLILLAFAGVVTSSDNLSIYHKHRANAHATGLTGDSCLLECFVHEVLEIKCGNHRMQCHV